MPISQYSVIDDGGVVAAYINFDGRARERAMGKLASFAKLYEGEEFRPYIKHDTLDTLPPRRVKVWQAHAWHSQFSRRGVSGHKTVKRAIYDIEKRNDVWVGRIVFDGYKMPVKYKGIWGWETIQY
jgi:hypothetical protein